METKDFLQRLLDEYLTKERWTPHAIFDSDRIAGCLVQQAIYCDMAENKSIDNAQIAVNELKLTLVREGKRPYLATFNDTSLLKDVRGLVERTIERL